MNSQPNRKVDKDKRELFDLVVSAIQSSGWNVLYAAPIDNPLQIIMQRDAVSYPLTVYIWNLTHGGGSRRPQGEYRIQITGVSPIAIASEGRTLLLGWWEPEGIFAGFDVTKHAGRPTASQSIQIGLESLRKATDNGLTPYNKGNGEIAFAIRPDLLAAYIQEMDALHEIGEHPSEVQIIDAPPDEMEQEADILEGVAGPRREVILSITKKLRDARFRQRVLTAYRNACAMCAIQTGARRGGAYRPGGLSKQSGHRYEWHRLMFTPS